MRIRLKTLARIFVWVSLLSFWGWSLDTPAVAAPSVTVRVVIERVLNTGTGDGCGAQDFYSRVHIDGEEFRSPVIRESADILPTDWEFTKAVDPDVGRIPIIIELWDSDSSIRCGGDEHMDISPGEGRDLGLTLDLSLCSISGDVSGDCEVTLESEGERRRRARIWFRIEASAPPGAPDLNVRCLHDPIWPQATDTVTFEAATFDGNMNPRQADTIEIWVVERDAPETACTAATTCTTGARGPFTGPTFAYACRAQVGAGEFVEEAWSGWRTVQVGLPASGPGVPVLFTGPRANRIDIVFIPDEDSYTDTDDPDFLADVHDMIEGGHYAREIFLKHQDKLNFWLALDTGDVDPSSGICPSRDVPRGWGDDYAFADSGVILHTDAFRDCAWRDRRIFSSDLTSFATIVHETGHSPFGLADEYCCDGGYFRTRVLPNMYGGQTACMDDTRRPIVEAEFGPDACQQIMRPSTGETRSWFRLDSASTASDDLMTTNKTPRTADETRIEWVFTRCSAPAERC
jgi:hypothetical protein